MMSLWYEAFYQNVIMEGISEKKVNIYGIVWDSNIIPTDQVKNIHKERLSDSI